MRALVILVLLAGTARADKVPPLPAPTERAPAKGPTEESATLRSSCSLDQHGCLATWRRAATLDPSNLELRNDLADYYYERGDKAAALAIMAQLGALACRECLTSIVKPQLHAWKDDAAFAARVRKGVRGRHTKYSKAASTVIAALTKGDWAKLAPFMPRNDNVGLPPSSDAPASIADIKRWLDEVNNGQADVRASGLTTCEGDCCYEIWDTLGGDSPSYLMGMCFASGPVLRETSWDSLR
jgi:hypothetical protein